MNALEQRKKKLSVGIFSLFFTWLVGSVSLAVIPVLGLFISKRWLPIVVLGLMLGVAVFSRAWRNRGMPICYRLPAMTTLTLVISAAVMIAINIIGVNWEPRWVKPQPFNGSIPYVSALVVYTVSAFCSLWYLMIGNKSRACVHCHISNGSYHERGLIARLFRQESALQLRSMCAMSALVMVIDWSYYYLSYINVNYNTRDIYFFVGIPVVLTVLSVIYFFTRYNSMWRHYCHNPMMEAVHGNSTALRYIVVVGDYVLLDRFNGMIVDTPVKCFVPFTTEVDMSRAADTFRNLTGLSPNRLVMAYESEETTTLANAFHYLCYFDNIGEIEGAKVEGQLYSLNRVLKMVKSGILAPELRSELERIYTVAMTWKTYTADGRRIYPIKNYRPSFRFRDLPGYDVDYNDKRWLAIHVNNEDKRFYRLRRVWNRYVNGIR